MTRFASIRGIFLAYTLLLALMACASNGHFKETYKSAEHKSQAYSKPLIVGISSNRHLRQRFENQVVSHLALQGISALSMLENTPQYSSLDKAHLLSAIEKLDTDSVVVVRILSEQHDAKVREGEGEIIEFQKGRGFLHVFQNDYKLVQYADEVTIETVLELSVDFYDANTQEKIRSAQTTRHDEHSAETFLDTEVSSITHWLVRSGLLTAEKQRG